MRRLLVALALLAAVAPVVTSADAPPAAADPAFVAGGSVNQVYAWGLGASVGVELLDAADAVVQTGTTDTAGAFLFRKVTAGTGYQVHRVTDDATVGGLTVTDPEDNPDDAHYAAEAAARPLGEGYGYLTTRDGTKLSVNVTFPEDGSPGPWPVVVNYSGYDPSQPGAPSREGAVYPYQGYVVVGINMRGTGCSGGAFEFMETLQATDGYDAIETISHQSWANGHVGMIGISYSGYSQLYVGATNPPHLDAITPLSPYSDTYTGILYPGGILNDGFAVGWASEREAGAKPAARPWAKTRINNGDTTCATNQLLRLQSKPLLDRIHATPWADHEFDYLNTETFVDKIKMPVYLASQWQDEQTGGSAANLVPMFDPDTKVFASFTNGSHVEPMGPTELYEAMVFIDLYVGHRIPHTSAALSFGASQVLADLFKSSDVDSFGFPYNAWGQQPSYAAALAYYESKPRIRIRWDNGGVTGKEGLPLARYTSRYSDWPVPGTTNEKWYLQPDGTLASTASAVPDTAARAASSYTYDPTTKRDHSFVGANEDPWGPHPDVHWDVLDEGYGLSFLTPAYTQTAAYAGQGSVDLWVKSSLADTDFEAALTEVRPDGKEIYIQSGWLRASHRKLDDALTTELVPVQTHQEVDAAPLPADQFTPVRFRLFPFAHVMRPGSKLRLSIEAPGGNQEFWAFQTIDGPGTNTVGHSAGMPSRIVLPRLPQSAMAGFSTDMKTVVPACSLPGVTNQAVSLRNEPCRDYVPDRKPTGVTAVADGDDVHVSWTAPPGAAPASYIVQGSNAAMDPSTVDGATTTVTFEDVPQDIPLEFIVDSVYDPSGGARSDASLPVTVRRFAERLFGSWNAFVTRQLTDFTGSAPLDQVAAGVASLENFEDAGNYIARVRYEAPDRETVNAVVRLYLAYFGRVPDASGFDYWVAQRKAGRTLSSISSAFAASSEFKRKYGTLTNTQFVDLVYQNVLGRPGDSGGRTYWIGQLTKHRKTRGQVMLNFSDGSEFRRKSAETVGVAVLYIKMIKRAPTAAELTAALAEIDGENQLGQIANQLLHSPEYVVPAS